ncbi:zona pellucida sperm-binding protein 4-like [Thalassophryne amazonica]|uniref:zona pellucida sperm-binding protein 4-like n=1 Tax=Thalassophryne amazonica TaxID=390379 RepID=UPI0014714E29|nr:zona pellucida sperm-binding protein 4-like [Thalassophryne amazonica]
MLLCCLPVAQFQFQPRGQQQTQTTQSQKQPPSNPAQKTPPVYSCEVEHFRRINCGRPGTAFAECQNLGCCFDGQSCYYGKPVTVQCLRNGRVILLLARDATLPYVDTESLSFLDQGQHCNPVATSPSYIVYFLGVNDCGALVSSTGTDVIYENRLSSMITVDHGMHGSITRDSYFELAFQCKYVGEGTVTIKTEINLVPPPLPVSGFGVLQVEIRLANGQCTHKGCNEEDAAYTSFYRNDEYPVTKVLRDRVYVEVRMLKRTDPNLVLTLERCWATAGPLPHNLPRWELLINGCPNYDDKYQTVLVPVDGSSGLLYPTHHRRFYFRMFTFLDQLPSDPIKGGTKVADAPVMLQSAVHVHCATTVCQPTLGDNCQPRCYRTTRDVSGSTQESLGSTVVVTSGKIIFLKT